MYAQMSILRDIIYSANAHGADLKKIFADLGVEPAELNDSEKKVPYIEAARLWDVVTMHMKDPLAALHLGEEFSPTILAMIGYLMQSCKNVYESFQAAIKFMDLVTNMSKISLEEHDGNVLISAECAPVWQHQFPDSARQSVEYALSGIIKLSKTLTGKKIIPIQTEFVYPSRSVHEYERVFRTAIHFNGEKNALTFRKSDLLTPIISYDKSLFEFFNTTLQQKLNSLTGDVRFSVKVKQVLINDFKGQTVSIEIAASKLHLTPRSLQRKLKAEETSYREIVSGLKKELAASIMGQTNFRVGEVAELLGYSDSSSFRKAYKKWSLV
jgi:AraC-like DNA-binding protein